MDRPRPRLTAPPGHLGPTGPDPAVAAVRVAVRRLLGVARDRGLLVAGTVAVACSGGADSLALAAAVRHEAGRAGLAVHGLVVDHGLQDGSAGVAERAAVVLRELGIGRVDVLAPTVDGPGGPEAAARRARYAALRSARPPGALVLLGHTRDDQAETVLLGLGRGSGGRSISGMRPLDPPWARPLLGVGRATTGAACAALGLEPWLDPHNADPRYTRVRLRHEVLPLLEDVLHGGVAAALARTADQLAEDGAALDELAAGVLAAATVPEHPGSDGLPPRDGDVNVREPAHSGDGRPTPGDTRPPGVATAAAELPAAPAAVLVTAFDGVHPAIRRRALRSWLLAAGVPALSDLQLRSVDALLGDWRGQGPVTLRFGLVVLRSHGRLHLKLAMRTEGK